MESLDHNGILVLGPPEPKELSIIVRGKKIELSPLQEEMAIAWVKKLGTPYIEDPVFADNFMNDFSKALGIEPSLKVEEIDFSEVIAVVEFERERKENMSKEEKKVAREERKIVREQLKEKYGYALVNGDRMELANYQTEPSGIFMGRGAHPLRGKWKQGATYSTITLNLSPDADVPDGDWGEIIWAPDSMWIAKWTDELTGKLKYVWLHDSTPIKQQREAEKFNKALKVEKKIDVIRDKIHEALESDDSRRRMVAAACYLIDNLSLRVGDEKDPEEADTVGATTLRVEHLTFKDTSVIFDFLGKDSVPWHKELQMPPDIYSVFKELYDAAEERLQSFYFQKGRKTRGDPKKIAQIFPDIGSTHVNRFLSGIDEDLTAKVFRTFHATVRMRDELKDSKIKKTDPDFIKKAAFKRANLEVARVMNHTKQAPKGWNRSAKRYEERLKKADKRIKKAKSSLEDKKVRLRKRKRKEKQLRTKKQDLITKQKGIVERAWGSVKSWRENRDRAKVTWDNARDNKSRIRNSRRKAQKTKAERLEEAQDRIDRTRATLDRAEENLRKTRERYEKSKSSLEKKQEAFNVWKVKSTERIARSEKTVERAKESIEKAELAKQKIEVDYALAKASRTWNLGTSLKSYIHPRIVGKWCKRVEFDWTKVYTKTLQRKFSYFFEE
jgi:DNA topoisomerase-1